MPGTTGLRYRNPDYRGAGIYEAIDRRPVISMPGTDHLEYDFPHQLVEHLPVEPGIRTFSVMAVGFTPTSLL